jgi:hypothetical protein
VLGSTALIVLVLLLLLLFFVLLIVELGEDFTEGIAAMVTNYKTKKKHIRKDERLKEKKIYFSFHYHLKRGKRGTPEVQSSNIYQVVTPFPMEVLKTYQC